MGKLEWWGYSTVKNFEHICNRLDSIPAFDRQTDGQTSCHGIVPAMHTRRAVNTRMVWLLNGEKILTEFTNVSGGHADTQTDGHRTTA